MYRESLGKWTLVWKVTQYVCNITYGLNGANLEFKALFKEEMSLNSQIYHLINHLLHYCTGIKVCM